MEKINLRKLTFYLEDIIKTPHDLKMVANACGCPWFVLDTKLGMTFKSYDFYIKPSYFGDSSKKKWIVVSVIYNSANCVTTQPCVFEIDSKIAETRIKRENLKFRKPNKKDWYYYIPQNLEKIE